MGTASKRYAFDGAECSRPRSGVLTIVEADVLKAAEAIRLTIESLSDAMGRRLHRGEAKAAIVRPPNDHEWKALQRSLMSAYEVAHELSLLSYDRWPDIHRVLNPIPEEVSR